MTRRDPFLDELEDFLDEYEGPRDLPVHLRDAILADLPSTRQSSRLGLRRYPNVHANVASPMQAGVMAAVIAVVVVIGASVFLGGRNFGDAAESAAPTASVPASATPAASTEPARRSAAAPVETAAAAGACEFTLRHTDAERAFSYDWSVSGLTPGDVPPTIEFRRGDRVFFRSSPADDPASRVDDSGVKRGGGSLGDEAIPLGTDPFAAVVVEPAQCEQVQVPFDPFEFRD